MPCDYGSSWTIFFRTPSSTRRRTEPSPWSAGRAAPRAPSPASRCGSSTPGPGVPAAYRTRIFDKFFRIEHHQVDQRPGGARRGNRALYVPADHRAARRNDCVRAWTRRARHVYQHHAACATRLLDGIHRRTGRDGVGIARRPSGSVPRSGSIKCDDGGKAYVRTWTVSDHYGAFASCVPPTAAGKQVGTSRWGLASRVGSTSALFFMVASIPTQARADVMCAIDMGSNSFRRIVGVVRERPLRQKIRSGRSASATTSRGTGGSATPSSPKYGAALAAFRGACVKDGAAPVVAVGTAAFRDAPNGPRAVEIAAQLGIAMEIATERRESELAYLVGSLGRDGYAVIDNGSRSIELVSQDRGRVAVPGVQPRIPRRLRDVLREGRWRRGGRGGVPQPVARSRPPWRPS